MTIQELGTAAEQQLPIKIFVFNNHQLGMVRQLQEFYCGKRYSSVHFQFCPDFAAIGRIYGMKGYTVSTPEQLAEILPEVLQTQVPVIVECIIDDEENVMPMVLAGAAIAEAIG
jgi:acetolactate synthase-1/2/3 large subunit